MLKVQVSRVKTGHVAALLVLAFVASCAADVQERNRREGVDECARGSHNCDVHAACSDTAGSFRCECNKGYFDDERRTWGGEATTGACKKCDLSAVQDGECLWWECLECDQGFNDGVADQSADEDDVDTDADRNNKGDVLVQTDELGENEDNSNRVSFSTTLIISLEEFNTEDMRSKYKAAVREAASVSVSQISVEEPQATTFGRRQADTAVVVPTIIDLVYSSRGVRNALTENLMFSLQRRGIDLKILRFHATSIQVPPTEDSSSSSALRGTTLGVVVACSTIAGLVIGCMVCKKCWRELRFHFDKSQRAHLPSSLVGRSAPDPSAPDVPSNGLVIQELVARIYRDHDIEVGPSGIMGMMQRASDALSSIGGSFTSRSRRSGGTPERSMEASEEEGGVSRLSSNDGMGMSFNSADGVSFTSRRRPAGYNDPEGRMVERDVFVGQPISPEGRRQPFESPAIERLRGERPGVGASPQLVTAAVTIGDAEVETAGRNLGTSGRNLTAAMGISGRNLTAAMGTSGRNLTAGMGTSGRNLTAGMGISGRNITAGTGTSGRNITAGTVTGTPRAAPACARNLLLPQSESASLSPVPVPAATHRVLLGLEEIPPPRTLPRSESLTFSQVAPPAVVDSEEARGITRLSLGSAVGDA